MTDFSLTFISSQGGLGSRSQVWGVSKVRREWYFYKSGKFHSAVPSWLCMTWWYWEDGNLNNAAQQHKTWTTAMLKCFVLRATTYKWSFWSHKIHFLQLCLDFTNMGFSHTTITRETEGNISRYDPTDQLFTQHSIQLASSAYYYRCVNIIFRDY